MAYRQNEALYHRMAMRKGFGRQDFSSYAFGKYWHVKGFHGEGEIEGVLGEFIWCPASRTVLVDYIEDTTTPLAYILIRPYDKDNEDSQRDAEKIYKEMMRSLPVYHLPELINHFKLVSTTEPVDLDEVYALGKGYDDLCQREVFDTLTVLAGHNDAQVAMAVVLTVGYISQPSVFNAVLELLTTHQNTDVALEAQRMIRAGEAVGV